MGLVDRIVTGAFEGFVAGGSVGAAGNALSRGLISWGGQPTGFSSQLGAIGAGEGLVKGGFAGAVVGGVMGALGYKHPIATVLDSMLGHDGKADSAASTFGDMLGDLAQVLRRS